MINEVSHMIRVLLPLEMNKYETCAKCTGFILCTFPAIDKQKALMRD